jgi:hypothetical protein
VSRKTARHMPFPQGVGAMLSPVRCRHCAKVYDLAKVAPNVAAEPGTALAAMRRWMTSNNEGDDSTLGEWPLRPNRPNDRRAATLRMTASGVAME